MVVIIVWNIFNFLGNLIFLYIMGSYFLLILNINCKNFILVGGGIGIG